MTYSDLISNYLNQQRRNYLNQQRRGITDKEIKPDFMNLAGTYAMDKEVNTMLSQAVNKLPGPTNFLNKEIPSVNKLSGPTNFLNKEIPSYNTWGNMLKNMFKLTSTSLQVPVTRVFSNPAIKTGNLFSSSSASPPTSFAKHNAIGLVKPNSANVSTKGLKTTTSTVPKGQWISTVPWALIGTAASMVTDDAWNPKSVKNAETKGVVTGALSGASTGASIGTIALPGIGTAVGGVLGGIIGAGTSSNKGRKEYIKMMIAKQEQISRQRVYNRALNKYQVQTL